MRDAAGQGADRLDPLTAALLLLCPRTLLQIAPHLVLPGAGPERGIHRAQQGHGLHGALEQRRIGAFHEFGELARRRRGRPRRGGQNDDREVGPGGLGGQMTTQDPGSVLLQPLLGEHDGADCVVQQLA